MLLPVSLSANALACEVEVTWGNLEWLPTGTAGAGLSWPEGFEGVAGRPGRLPVGGRRYANTGKPTSRTHGPVKNQQTPVEDTLETKIR